MKREKPDSKGRLAKPPVMTMDQPKIRVRRVRKQKPFDIDAWLNKPYDFGDNDIFTYIDRQDYYYMRYADSFSL